MNKEDYVQLHTVLAKLKYELEIIKWETNNQEYIEEIEKHIKSIDDLMTVFMLECD